MTRDSPVVAVVILNWNQEKDTSDCLTSLRAVNGVSFRVILVDNGSSRESVDRLVHNFPEAAVIRLPENRGFAAGNNVGILRALQDGASHILLLNNDTLVDPAFLPPLLDGLTVPEVGVVGPKIYSHPEITRLWFAGGRIDWRTGRQWHLGAGEVDEGQWDSPSEVHYITACCLLAPAKVFHEIGGLDERYFIYFEETDWNLRARRRGYRCRYVPGSRIYHKVSQAMKTGSPTSDYYYARNRLLLFRNHAPTRYRLWLIALYTARSLRYAYTLRTQGRIQNAAAVVRGIHDFYRARFGKCPLRFTPDISIQPA
ncbi:MAG: glycosyltransferase family 2 protein [Nitrospirae bacterium]|nr:glycosyltransferase family 2 protein [Nitrospirota bacterium]